MSNYTHTLHIQKESDPPFGKYQSQSYIYFATCLADYNRFKVLGYRTLIVSGLASYNNKPDERLLSLTTGTLH